jgi:hypothetical protein
LKKHENSKFKLRRQKTAEQDEYKQDQTINTNPSEKQASNYNNYTMPYKFGDDSTITKRSIKQVIERAYIFSHDQQDKNTYSKSLVHQIKRLRGSMHNQIKQQIPDIVQGIKYHQRESLIEGRVPKHVDFQIRNLKSPTQLRSQLSSVLNE